MAEAQKYLGVIAEVREDGSVVFPLSFLQTAGITPGSKIEIFGSTEYVFIRSIEQECDLCGTNGNPRKVGNKLICESCIEQLKNLDK